MTKKLLIGTTLAVIIVLAGFSSVANAQTIKTIDNHPSLLQHIIEQKVSSDVNLLQLIDELINLILVLIALLMVGPQ